MLKEMNRRECVHLLTGLTGAARKAPSHKLLVYNPARLFKFS